MLTKSGLVLIQGSVPRDCVKLQQTYIRTVDILALRKQTSEAVPFDQSSSVTKEMLQTVTV